MTRLFAMVLVFGITLIAGCGENLGEVAGKVTFRGEMVNLGTISFLDGAGKATNANIQADGSYLVSRVPLGKVTVCVQTHEVAPIMVRPDAAPNSVKIPRLKHTPIPALYGDPKTSPLKLEVKAGRQEFQVNIQK